MRKNRDFRAVAGFADNLKNLDRIIVNFGNFQFDDRAYQFGIGAGQHHLQTRIRFLYVHDKRAYAVVFVVHFARRLELYGKNSFHIAQVHVNIAVALALIIADDNFADLILVFGHERVFLNFG